MQGTILYYLFDFYDGNWVKEHEMGSWVKLFQLWQIYSFGFSKFQNWVLYLFSREWMSENCARANKM